MTDIQSDITDVVEYAWADELRAFEEWRVDGNIPVRHRSASDAEHEAALKDDTDNPSAETAERLARLSTGHIFCSLARLAATTQKTNNTAETE